MVETQAAGKNQKEEKGVYSKKNRGVAVQQKLHSLRKGERSGKGLG